MTGDDDVELGSELVSCRMAILRLSFPLRLPPDDSFASFISLVPCLGDQRTLAWGEAWNGIYLAPIVLCQEYVCNILCRFAIIGDEKI